MDSDNNPFSKIYNTSAHGKAVTVSGLYQVGGVTDKIKLSISVTSGAQSTYNPDAFVENTQYVFSSVNAGSYTVSVSSTLMGESSGNYQLQSQSRTWIIEKKTINLTSSWFVEDTQTPYSDSAFVYDGTPKTVKAGYVQGAASDNDYKVYDGDILSFVYQTIPP